MSLKCGIIFFGVILIGDALLETINLVIITQNEYFDSIYPLIFGVLLIFYFTAAAFFIYWFCKDSQTSRGYLPMALIFAAIGALCLGLWIIIYICCIYPHKQVYVNKYDRKQYFSEEPGDEYHKISKGAYVLNYCLSPLIQALFYWLCYCIVAAWVKRH